ncbi:MAG TPA: isoleucine--tRNA ligase [Candidatus Limnocylindria bacterium]|nr:isoleucine--tRNA ligase [Candidatus Limnocylindria bacterium]
MAPYRPVPPQIDLPALDREILAFWREHEVFARSLTQTQDGPLWVFYEGPPTANGMPGTHHVETRVFKDVFPRYRTMKGHHVPRKAGWDCHGLPVELAVEKELGFTGKGDIEAYGVAEFNARCRASVERHVGEFEAMTERMGYWVDMSEAYRTMDASYVESVWWSLKAIFDQGLLVQDHRVAPYCPRCGTGLSDHELAQGYETVVDPSVYVRLPLTSGPLAGRADLLVWTTTPWTLVSNTAVAANPDVDYVVVSRDADRFVVAAALVEAALGEGWTVEDTLSGRSMERWTYSRPFTLVDIPDAHYVVLDGYVTTEDGTGLVHQSPAFGADDLRICKAYGLPVVNPVTRDGHFEADVPLVGGQFFKKADADLVADLSARGLLFKHLPYEHSYPHCWRCHTALLYYAQPSWYIRTTAIKEQLLAENENTHWYPETIKHGRYGDWLTNNVDWALSRDRYWGTPLPIWRCGDDETHLTCVGSLAELGQLSGQDVSALDPHRPYVDAITLPCPTCGAEARRVPQVIDGWYDSGAMPFAQWGYPHAPGSAEVFEGRYPADFICEAIDQTRGWFYTLMAVGTLVMGSSSYRHVVCLGHIQDEQGRKMSKHLGNVLEPIGLMDAHGADAVRWFMVAGGSPWQGRRVGHTAIQDVVRKTLLTYWNVVAFQSLYARTAGWEPAARTAPPAADRPVLDRWALSEVHRLAGAVDAALETYDTQRAGRLLAAYVDDLSNWYVRRSRRRFWAGDPSALATLHECLEIVTLLMAPITPFITERVWQDLFAATSDDLPDSVHLAPWPAVDPALLDDELATQVALVRRLVELGRAARADSGVRTRQPLGRALVSGAGWATLSEDLRRQVADELNVGSLESLGSAEGDLVDVSAKANFRALGKRFGQRTPRVAEAVAAADAAALSASLSTTGAASVQVDGETIELTADEVVVTEAPRSGWAVAADAGETVALDLEITPSLRRAGLAREAVRMIQEARKTSGFDVSDRIVVRWAAAGETAGALEEHATAVAEEVLAVGFERVDDAAIGPEGHSDRDLGLTITLERL